MGKANANTSSTTRTNPGRLRDLPTPPVNDLPGDDNSHRLADGRELIYFDETVHRTGVLTDP
jgi:hypothetical protein